MTLANKITIARLLLITLLITAFGLTFINLLWHAGVAAIFIVASLQICWMDILQEAVTRLLI